MLAPHAAKDQPLIFVANPSAAFARAGHLLYPPAAPNGGVSAGAQIDPSAVIGCDAQIDFGAVIGPGVTIGQRCHIASHVVLGAGVTVGDHSRIGANTTISNALIGAGVEIGSSCTVGGPGFGFVAGPKARCACCNSVA